jgi:hypothetical protein
MYLHTPAVCGKLLLKFIPFSLRGKVVRLGGPDEGKIFVLSLSCPSGILSLRERRNFVL